MDDADTPTSESSKPKCRVWPLLAVVALALATRVWVVARSEVAARDSVGFIKYALRVEHEPFAKVLREGEQPPGYPLAVLAASLPVRIVAGGVTPESMVLSAQVASAVFGVLLVFPMVWLGNELHSWRLGLLAAALFQCLPAWVRFTSDGLSEGMFLFWVVTALWLAARAFRRSTAISFAIAGLSTGAAFLTRPEGAEVALAVVLVLLGGWVFGRVALRPTAMRCAALSAGFLVLFGPYFAITGRITNKPTGRFLMGDPTAEKSYFGRAGSPAALAVWWQDSTDLARNRTVWAIQALVRETASSARQVGFGLAVIGLWLWHRRVHNTAGWVLIIVSALHAMLLVRMTSSIGYLSERHTALVVVTGCYPASLAILVLMGKLAPVMRLPNAALVTGLVAATFLSAVPSLRKPLHYNRAGHKAAGQWLAVNAPASFAICDPFCWAHYYAGRVFRETAQNDPADQFVIVEPSDNQHSRLPLMPEARAKATAGQLVYHWPESVPPERAQVQVYRWKRPANELSPTASRSSQPTHPGE